MNFDIDPREINLQGPDGMQLVKLLRGLIAAIESGGDEPEPGDDSEFFYCTYGTTTYSEIQNALAEDKVPICIRNGLYYYLVNTTQNRYVFACYNPTNNYIYAVRCLTDRWDNVTFMLQERLTWDYTPTQGSTRPVTSGGVWTALQNAGGSDIDPYQQYPEMDGTASPGSSDDYARGDHVHPTDTSRAAASEITRIDAALATKADQASIEQTIEDTVDDWLSVQAPSIGTLSYAAKQALLACFRKVAWIDDQGQSYYNALESELFPDATLESITAVFTQGSAVIYDTDSLDTLRQYLVVTATYSDSTTATVTDYTLSGTLTDGTSIITVSYGGKNTTFSVLCESILYPLANGSFTFSGNYNQKITISNGRHIKIEYPIGDSFANGSIINLSSLSNNGSTSTIDSNGSAVNNLSSILFTIPANSNIELAIENLNHTRSEMLSTNGSQFLLNFRKTGASTSIISGGVGFYLNTADDKMNVTGTIDAQTSASCLFLYEQRVLSGITVEFDISLRVNGVKWV